MSPDRAPDAPTKNSAQPYDTDARYCIYSEAFNSYLYTPAWVEEIVREIGRLRRTGPLR